MERLHREVAVSSSIFSWFGKCGSKQLCLRTGSCICLCLQAIAKAAVVGGGARQVFGVLRHSIRIVSDGQERTGVSHEICGKDAMHSPFFLFMRKPSKTFDATMLVTSCLIALAHF
jgi:hypothetical protein